MNQGSQKSIADTGCVTLVSVGTVHVAIDRNLKDEFDQLPIKIQARFIRIMEMWCQGHRLTPEMFNYNEGRSPKQNRMVQAFKGFKIRLYGIDHQVKEGRAFLILEHDPAKKQDKADPKILARAKARADEI